MRDRIGGRDEPTVREPEQIDPVLTESDTQLLDVGDVVVEQVGLRVGAAAGAARVDEEQGARRVETAEIVELAAVEARPPGWQTSSGPSPRRVVCSFTRARA